MTARLRWRLAALAALLVALVYAPAWRFDLFWDDFLVLRPWTRAEIWRAMTGPWDPWHLFPTFYRPLGALFYAASFAAVGTNPHALFLLACANLVAIGVLIGTFVARETNSASAGAAATTLYLAHPALVSSVGVWYTNQFHALATMTALAALLVWQRARVRPARAWWPLAAIVAAGALIKEDTLMLAPALVSLQWLRARTLRDVPRPAPAIVWGAVGLVAAMLAWRTLMLGGIGGFPLPASIEWAARDLLRGPYYVLSGAPGVSRAGLATAALVIALVCGVAWWAAPRDRWLIIAGGVLFAWCNAPLVLVSDVSRYHLLTLAVVLAAAGAIDAAKSVFAARRLLAAGAGVILLAALVVTGRGILAGFAPCGSDAKDGYEFLSAAHDLPPELLEWFHARLSACEPYTSIRALDVITWGGHRADASEMPAAETIASHAVMLVRPGTALEIEARAAAGTPAGPALHVASDSGQRWTIALGAAWQPIRVPLADDWRVWLRGQHRVALDAEGPGAEIRASVSGPATARR